jgi:hypothetical protein
MSRELIFTAAGQAHVFSERIIARLEAKQCPSIIPRLKGQNG